MVFNRCFNLTLRDEDTDWTCHCSFDYFGFSVSLPCFLLINYLLFCGMINGFLRKKLAWLSYNILISIYVTNKSSIYFYFENIAINPYHLTNLHAKHSSNFSFRVVYLLSQMCKHCISSLFLIFIYFYLYLIFINVSIKYYTKVFYYIEGFDICFCLWENSLKMPFLSWHSFILKVFFNYLCMCLCVYIHIWVWYSWSSEEDIGPVGTRITPHVLHHILWVLGNKSSPLKEKQALLIAETSIKIPIFTALIWVWF